MPANSYWIELKENNPFSSEVTCRSNIPILKNYVFLCKKGITTVFSLSKEIISTNGYDFLKIDDVVFHRNKGLLLKNLTSGCGAIDFGEWVGVGKLLPLIEQCQIYFNKEVYLVNNFSVYSMIAMSKTRIECNKIDNVHVLLGCLVYCWTSNRNDRLS